MLDEILKYNPKADTALITKAFEFSKKAHEGTKRDSGETYFVHPFGTAMILAKMNAGSTTIAAGLLHDVIENTKVTIPELKTQFGGEIASIVEGLTNIEGVYFNEQKEWEAENLRKVILAAGKDMRIIMIKLADRLHNMRTLSHKPLDVQKRIAKFTMDVYVPIAYKLGISEIKAELEDLSFKYLDPENYNRINDMIKEHWDRRKKKTEELIDKLNSKLKENGIEASILSRYKSVYSTYKKMKKYGFTDVDRIYDIIAIRVIVDSIEKCYAVLQIVHNIWQPFHKVIDYIANPKPNQYQSIHTTVKDGNDIAEIQVRTNEMHNIAEYGVASHWTYKKSEKDKYFDNKIRWLKQIMEWKLNSKNAEEFAENLKINLFKDEITVFTPKGDPIILPEGATPVDFAYMVHTHLGRWCNKSELNGKLVPLDTILKDGDKVKIITTKNSVPSREWLNFVKTTKARSKIRAFLNIKSKKLEEDVAKDIMGKASDVEVYGKYAGKKYPISLSKCCNPTKEDEIVGIFTKDEKITIHKKNCPNLATVLESRKVVVLWKRQETKDVALFDFIVSQRSGLISEILNELSKAKMHILSIDSKKSKNNNHLIIETRIDKGKEDYGEFIKKMMKIKGMVDITVKKR